MTGWFISGNDEDEGSCKSDENPTKNEKKQPDCGKEIAEKRYKNLAKSAENTLKFL